jgi:hypothetical protein
MNAESKAAPLSPYLRLMVEERVLTVGVAEVANRLKSKERQEQAVEQWETQGIATMEKVVSRFEGKPSWRVKLFWAAVILFGCWRFSSTFRDVVSWPYRNWRANVAAEAAAETAERVSAETAEVIREEMFAPKNFDWTLHFPRFTAFGFSKKDGFNLAWDNFGQGWRYNLYCAAPDDFSHYLLIPPGRIAITDVNWKPSHPDGVYRFVVTAVDKNGRESAYSDPVRIAAQ